MRRWLVWAPLIGFGAVLAVVMAGLFDPADRTVRSALVGKRLPEFSLAPSITEKPGLGTAAFRQGEPRLLNVFASWCVPCIAEAPHLLALKRAGVKIDAIAVRDTPANIRRFLARHGDPYERIGDDQVSAVQFALGSSGVPETFVIDGQGRIVMQHVGDIRADEVPAILAAVRAAK